MSIRSTALRLLATATAGLVVVLGLPPAQAATADTVEISANLTREGALTVTQTITLTAPSDVSPITEAIPAYVDRSGQRYTFTLSDLTVTADGQAIGVSQKKSADITQISFSPGQATTLVVSYAIAGATTTAVDGKVDFTWDVLRGLNLPVTKVTGSVLVPAGAVNYACQAGVVGALANCSTYTAGVHGNTALTFTQNALGSGQAVQTTVVFPSGVVTVTEQVSTVWSISRAFTPRGTQIGIMALLLAAGGLILFGLWRKNRQAGYQGVPVPVAEFTGAAPALTFTPDPAVRPGMVGTLVDSRVDPADIVATMLDLAVRGHLLITELETPHYAVADWTFTRGPGGDELLPYEKALLDTLTGGEVKVSALAGHVHPAIDNVQQGLYDEVVSTGWFSRVPSQRSPLVLVGWIGVAVAAVITAVLVAFTTFGLVGLALIALAIIALTLAYQVHHVTPKGAAVYAGLQALAKQLHDHKGAEIAPAEQHAQISRILPYAVVLGSWEQWLQALADADDDDLPDPEELPWYHGPADWHMRDLTASLDALITVVTGRLFSRG